MNAIERCILEPKSIGKTLVTSDEHHSIADIAKIIIETCGTGKIKSIPWPPNKKVQRLVTKYLTTQAKAANVNLKQD